MKARKNVTKIENLYREDLRNDFVVAYMQKLYPWFSETDILKAIESKGPHLENVLCHLNDKSGVSKNNDDSDY